MLDRLPAHVLRPRAALVAILLLLTLGLAGVLAYQAWDADRSHRATSESALRDYAAFAAWEFSRSAERDLTCVITMSLRPLARTDWHAAGAPMPHPAALEEMDCECALVPPRYYFRLDLASGELITSGERPSSSARAWLADRVDAHARTVYEEGWNHASLIRDGGEGADLVAYHLERGENGEAGAAYGLVTEVGNLRPALSRVAEQATLLPPSLTRGMERDSLLTVQVGAGGHSLYRSSSGDAPTYGAVDTLDSQFGGLSARLGLRADAAEQLVIGGLPRSRLPMLFGVMALAVGLVLVALYQFRRQHELARLRADFVSGTSHELRTPLAQIRMFAETLLLGRVRSEEERRHSLEIIVQEARRLTHLVANVLQFSDAERHGSRIDPQPTDVSGLVSDVLDGFAPLARRRQVELRTEVEAAIIAVVDRDALRQILVNLLDNAVKYGPPGQEVTIGTALVDERLEVRVEDEGPGIPASERERIWGSFSRLDRDADSAVGGSGIGLAVVRDLAQAHGGHARVEDAPDGGARFIIEMPDAWRGSGNVESGMERERAAA